MQKQNKWRLLHLFGEDAEGASTIPPAPTPQATEETGDTAKSSDPAAGESERAKRRSEEFRALMEGEYKDLFTAYFQETFNRRFKEQKEMKEQLLHARAVADAAAECFGATGEDLLLALRTEHERRNASADTPREDPAKQEALQAQLRAALDAARTETEARVLSDRETMSYTYYQENVKPKPETDGIKGYVCKVCGYVYEGEELPDDIVCPLCKHGAADFERIE